MAKFFVYGEDGLTLKNLREELGKILCKLDDKTDPDLCTVFFRPSLGRTGHYGEFDAIIVASENAYLVESKWDQSNELRNGLREEQLDRHRIMRWFRDHWKGETGQKWDEFAEKYYEEFRRMFPKKYIPRSQSAGRETILSMNLQSLLEKMRDKNLVNVLLVFHQGELPSIVQRDFHVVPMK